LQDVETIKKAESAVTATSFNIFEGRLINFTKYSSFRVDREIDIHLIEEATVFDSEKARHT
jgi:hypothetical protein